MWYYDVAATRGNEKKKGSGKAIKKAAVDI